jgi:integrase
MSQVSWAEFSAQVLTLYAPPIRRIATFRKTRQVLTEFERICPNASDLSELTIARWIGEHTARKPITNVALLRTLQAATRFGLKRGYFLDPFDPRGTRQWYSADELEENERDELFPRHRTREEIRLVLAQADTEAAAGVWEALRLRAAVYCWCYLGARKTEILGLRKADVDLTARVVEIRTHRRRRLKTGSSAAKLPLPWPLAVVLAGWLPHAEGEYLFPNHAGMPWLHGPRGHKALDQVRELGRRAGVEGLTILALRHSFGTIAEEWGWSDLTLQMLMRHARRRTQEAYRHRDLGQLHRAADEIAY